MCEKQIYHPNAYISNGLKEQWFKQWFKFSAAVLLQRLGENLLEFCLKKKYMEQ